MSWITENLCQWLADFIGGLIDTYGELINNIFYSIVDAATKNEYVVNAQKFILVLSLALIGVVVMKIVISGYLLESDYDSDADPFNILVKIVEVVAFILNSSWLFNWMLKTSKSFSSDLISSSDVGVGNHTETLLEIFTGDIGRVKTALMCTLFLMVIAFVIFSVVAGLRGAELIAMNLFFPFFCLDLLTNNRERWNNFMMAYIISFFTYSFQILFFMLALKSYNSVSITNTNYCISTIVWLIMAIKTPRFLEKYLYKSGVSNAASSGVRMVFQSMVLRGAIS